MHCFIRGRTAFQYPSGKMDKPLFDTGFDQNTIIIFAADHGDMLGEKGLWYKMTFFEASVRVPLIMPCPVLYRKAGGSTPKAKPHRSRMSYAVLEKVIRAYMASKQAIYSLIWHGGEPALMPAAFFETAIGLRKKYAAKGSRISNSLQTNGLSVPDDLAGLMARYRFICGVSLDGPPAVHDMHKSPQSK